MGKTKNDAPVIEAGKAITITAESREDATNQLNELRKQAAESGLIQAPGGLIEHREGVFSAVITFVEQ